MGEYSGDCLKKSSAFAVSVVPSRAESTVSVSSPPSVDFYQPTVSTNLHLLHLVSGPFVHGTAANETDVHSETVDVFKRKSRSSASQDRHAHVRPDTHLRCSPEQLRHTNMP